MKLTLGTATEPAIFGPLLTNQISCVEQIAALPVSGRLDIESTPFGLDSLEVSHDEVGGRDVWWITGYGGETPLFLLFAVVNQLRLLRPGEMPLGLGYTLDGLRLDAARVGEALLKMV